MIKVIFECFKNKNQYQEEFEFKDNTTDEEIEDEFKEWVWSQINDQFGWHRV